MQNLRLDGSPNRRRVSNRLIVGVVLLPIIFVWFLLGKGYSTKARIFGFLWFFLGLHFLALLPFFVYGLMLMYL